MERVTYLFTIGKLKANVAPLQSGLFSAHILPTWASIIPLQMYNPSTRIQANYSPPRKIKERRSSKKAKLSNEARDSSFTGKD